jgi:N6-L-threonylcarbamoyladenine synthase
VIVLGIESSCDESACAIVQDGRLVRASVVASQHDLHRAFGGVVPELASREHLEKLLPVVRAALEQAGLTFADLAAVAVGHRPGLIGSLLIGVASAKALAWSLNLPLVGVDHVHAHLYAGLLTHNPADHPPAPTSDLFPALGLVVSGGHTSLYALRSWRSLSRLGATIDDALGEAYDKAATILGLPYPGGPNLDALASDPSLPAPHDRAVDFPVSRLSPESLDFSFSGLKTAMLYAVRGVPGARGRPAEPLTPARRRDLAASFQRAACQAVILKLERAHERAPGVRTLFAGGGVTANTRLRAELAAFAQRRGLELIIPPLSLCVDNAAMIAGLGAELLASGVRDDLTLSAVPTTSL